MLWTDFHTVSAADAFFHIVEQLYFWQLAFRIGTPFTVQRTSFEKYNSTDARTVIDGKLLNIEYSTCFCSICFSHFLYTFTSMLIIP